MGRWYKPGNASVRPMKRRERSSDSMNREHETPEFLDRPLDLAWDVRVFVAPRVVPQRLSCGDGPDELVPLAQPTPGQRVVQVEAHHRGEEDRPYAGDGGDVISAPANGRSSSPRWWASTWTTRCPGVGCAR